MSNLGHDGCIENQVRLQQHVRELAARNVAVELEIAALGRVIAEKQLEIEQLEREKRIHYSERVRMMRNRTELMKLARSLGATSEQVMEALSGKRPEVAE